MNTNARQLADADARVRSWPTLPADFRDEVAEVAVIQPQLGAAILCLRGVEHTFEDVFAAREAAVALGVPLDRVRVNRFQATPYPKVLAESPALTS